MGLEGIICKLRNGAYTAGRSYDWLKVKSSNREEFVIGGFTDPGIRGGFGALLLGYHNNKHELIYAGKVGTGFSDAFLASFRKRLDAIAQKESPFADLRRTTGEARGAHWVRPQLVAQVAFTEWTRGGHLRHPSFLGLREDKAASSIVRDRALGTTELPHAPTPSHKTAKRKSAPAAKAPAFVSSVVAGEGTLAGVRITSPGKVLFGDGDITKLELAQYYLSIARWILPHVANRPLSLVRCPEGAGKECFFQKHPGVGTPKTIRLVPVKEKNTTRNYLVVERLLGLTHGGQLLGRDVKCAGGPSFVLGNFDAA